MALYEGYSSDSDGQISKGDVDYDTAHNAMEGIVDDSIQLIVGQSREAGYYSVNRSFVFFDTSSIPSSSIIDYAKLSLWVFTEGRPDINFDVVIRNGQPTYPHDPLVVGDYLYTHYSGDGGSVNTFGITGDNYTDIILNPTGRNWIQKGSEAITKLAIIGSTDIASEEPADFTKENIFFYSKESESGIHPPKLTIIYTPLVALTVKTKNISNVEATYLTANGKVTDTGGFTVTKRGFQWGLTETDTWFAQDTGEFSTGSFSKVITGLTEGTIYYIRAFAENTNSDIAYGNWIQITAGSLYGIYEESNSPTICFYVRRAGGKWSIKHGPYTEDQADIEIGKILVEGKGKYQIKFTSDVLTGLSVNIMTKLDIKAR